MTSEGIKFIGDCETCKAAGRLTKTGTQPRLMLRGGKPFCLTCYT